jgi:hypothetical protein
VIEKSKPLASKTVASRFASFKVSIESITWLSLYREIVVVWRVTQSYNEIIHPFILDDRQLEFQNLNKCVVEQKKKILAKSILKTLRTETREDSLVQLQLIGVVKRNSNSCVYWKANHGFI